MVGCAGVFRWRTTQNQSIKSACAEVWISSPSFPKAGAGRTEEIPLLVAEPQLIPSPSLTSRLG